jgi:hypothetical protein
LVINPDTKRVVSVQSDPKNLVSNQTFIDTTTRIIDKYGLEVNNFSIGKNGGVIVNACSPSNAWGLQGLTNEDHYGGVSFTNSPDAGFKVSPFMYRLVCANGMIGTAFNESFSLGQMDAKTMESFWTQLNDMATRSFRPVLFDEKVRLAMNTNASLWELQTAHDVLRKYSNAEHKELEAWVPLMTTKDAFHNARIDTFTMGKDQMKNARRLQEGAIRSAINKKSNVTASGLIGADSASRLRTYIDYTLQQGPGWYDKNFNGITDPNEQKNILL